MARQAEFYKGRRKKRNFAIVPLVIFLVVFGSIVVLFYSTQKYAVISDDGVSVELPLLTSGTKTYDATGKEVAVFEQVDAEIRFEEADYSSVKATAGKKVKPVKAIFVPYEDVTEDRIGEYANRLSSGNALLLNLKQRNGYMAWYSDAPVAYSYGLNMNAVDSKQRLEAIVSSLKDDDIYLVAQISCCMDELLGAHSTEVCLRNQYGMYYYDENGYWLDPYSTIVRNYAVQLANELYDMGFDEVLLADVMHPVAPPLENADGTYTPQVSYTREMSTNPTPVGAVCGFAVNVAEQLSDRPEGKFLSIYVNSGEAITQADTANGQDCPLFLKLFDRVYYNTDKYEYTFKVNAVGPFCAVGSVYDRFVPVVINYLPDNSSWVLVDKDV